MFDLIEPSTGWKVDFVVPKDRPFSKQEFDRRMRTEIAGVEVYVATAEDTMLAKLEWGASSRSDRQMDDVAAIASASEIDVDYLSHWASELGVEAQLEAALVEVMALSRTSDVSIPLDLASIGDLFESAKSELESTSSTATIRRSSDDGRSKHSIGLSVTGTAAEGELWVWDSGEGELIIGASVEDVTQIHLSDLTLEHVREALDRLLKAVV